jgi:hypothetical protein
MQIRVTDYDLVNDGASGAPVGLKSVCTVHACSSRLHGLRVDPQRGTSSRRRGHPLEATDPQRRPC